MECYVSESNYVVSSDTLHELRSELRRLGAGVSRTVYDLGDGTVLKVCHDQHSHAGNNLSEWEMWQKVQGTEWEIHFAECIAVSDDGSWLIQRAIDQTFESDHVAWSEWYREIGADLSAELHLGDLHYGNVGTTVQGQVKIIDYAYDRFLDMGWLLSNRSDSDCDCDECKPCYCNLCDCERCKPQGCDCDEFEGCNETECAQCYSLAVALVLSVPVCETHNVDRKAWDLNFRNYIREVRGQIPMFQPFHGKEVQARIS